VKTQPPSDEALNPHFVVLPNPILLKVCLMSTNNNDNLHSVCWEQTGKQLNLTPVITPVLEPLTGSPPLLFDLCLINV